jgi:hypothetical protein
MAVNAMLPKKQSLLSPSNAVLGVPLTLHVNNSNNKNMNLATSTSGGGGGGDHDDGFEEKDGGSPSQGSPHSLEGPSGGMPLANRDAISTTTDKTDKSEKRANEKVEREKKSIPTIVIQHNKK